MILQQCTEPKQAFNSIVQIEQSLTIRDTIINSPIISQQGDKLGVIQQIIRIIECYLEVTGTKLEKFQIRTLAGDLFHWFKNDALDDVILFFKMIRTGELGKVGFTSSFNEKIMLYVPLFMEYKSEMRERIIEQQKRKFNQSTKPVEMSAEALKKFNELQKKISSPIQQRKEVFSVSKALSSLDGYLETLPETCKKLSDSDLRYELRRTEFNNKEAHAILTDELNRRKQIKKNGKKI